MATESQRETATIYTFPARGRFAGEAGRAATTSQNVQREVESAVDGAWYHDEAIRDERARKDH